MKKVLALVLTVVLISVFFISCGNSSGKPNGVYDMYFNETNGSAMGMSRYEFKGDTVRKINPDGSYGLKGKVTYDGNKVDIVYEDGSVSDYIYDPKTDVLSSPAPYESFSLRKSK